MPDAFSWRDHTGDARLPPGNYASDAVDQHAKSWCGCCFVVCAAQMVEDRVRIAEARRTGTTRVRHRLCLQTLLDHFQWHGAPASWNPCHGGYPQHVLQSLRDGDCPTVWEDAVGAHARWTGYPRETTECAAAAPYAFRPGWHPPSRFPPAEVKRRLVAYGPVVLEVDGDVIKSTDRRGRATEVGVATESNHAVCVVGWRGDAWLVRNSWGGTSVPARVPPDATECVRYGANECVRDLEPWRSLPDDPGFLLLPMAYPSLHRTDPSPWMDMVPL